MKTISLLLCLLSFLFCKENQEIRSQDPGETIEISFPTDPISLDPIFATDLTTEKFIRFLHSTLFRLDREGKPQPFLVDQYQWNPDTLVLEITPYSSIETSQIQHSLKRLMDTPGPRKQSYQSFREIRIHPTGKSISIRMKEKYRNYPLDFFLTLLSLPAASILGETGPYEMVDWKKGNFIQLKKRKVNKDIDLFRIDRLPANLIIRIIPQSTSGLFLFSKSKLDALKLSDFLLTHPIAKTNTLLAKKGRSVQYVAINNNNPCFDSHFRDAVNLVIDRNKIIQNILENQAELTYSSIPISRLPEQERVDLLPVYDPDLAKETLKKSKCYPEILERKLDFRMRGDDENQSKGKAVVEYLKSLGLNISIKGMEKAPLYKENGMGLGDFTFLTWYADYESPIAFLDPLFHSEKLGNGGNRAFYKNPSMDEAIRKKEINRAIRILIQDKPWIFLWSIQENYLLSPKLDRYPTIQEYL